MYFIKIFCLDELEMYLDPVFGETGSQTDRVKQSIVLSQQNQIQQDLDTLERVRDVCIYRFKNRGLCVNGSVSVSCRQSSSLSNIK